MRISDLLVPRHRHPVPERRQHLEVGGERSHRDVEADLVVTLAGRPVAHPGGALPGGYLDQQLGDQGAAEGGRQRVLALVQRARL